MVEFLTASGGEGAGSHLPTFIYTDSLLEHVRNTDDFRNVLV